MANLGLQTAPERPSGSLTPSGPNSPEEQRLLSLSKAIGSEVLPRFGGTLISPNSIFSWEPDPKPPVSLQTKNGSSVLISPQTSDSVRVDLWNPKANLLVTAQLNPHTGAVGAVEGSRQGTPLSATQILEQIRNALREASPRSGQKVQVVPGRDPVSSNRPPAVPPTGSAPTPLPADFCVSGPPVAPHEVTSLRSKLPPPPDTSSGNGTNGVGPVAVHEIQILEILGNQGRVVTPPPEIAGVIQRITQAAGGDFRVTVVDTPHPFARSSDDGIVVLSTGLLHSISDDKLPPDKRDQILAFILAHECSHDLYNHTKNGDALVRSRPGECGRLQAVFDVMSVQNGHRNEFQADAGANELIKKAGFAPLSGTELTALLERVTEAQRRVPDGIDPLLAPPPRSPWGGSHPSPAQRGEALDR